MKAPGIKKKDRALVCLIAGLSVIGFDAKAQTAETVLPAVTVKETPIVPGAQPVAGHHRERHRRAD